MVNTFVAFKSFHDLKIELGIKERYILLRVYMTAYKILTYKSNLDMTSINPHKHNYLSKNYTLSGITPYT